MKVYNYYASLFVGKMHCILSEHTVLVSQIACWTYNTVPFFNIKAYYYYKGLKYMLGSTYMSVFIPCQTVHC